MTAHAYNLVVRAVRIGFLLAALACSRESSRSPNATPSSSAPPVTVRIETTAKTLNYVLHTEEAERIVLSFMSVRQSVFRRRQFAITTGIAAGPGGLPHTMPALVARGSGSAARVRPLSHGR